MSASISTMMEIRDYIDNVLYIRRPSSWLGDYDALVSHCFSFFHRDRERYTVHFHLRRYSHCEGGQLLREGDWAAGSYEVLFAHFVRRAWVGGQNSPSVGYGARESTTSPVIESPESPWIQPPLPNVGDHVVLPPAPLHPSPAVRRPGTQWRSTNSTTVYSIGPRIPSTRYNATYFSGPYVFIPLRPRAPQPRSHLQRYTAPFPCFRPQSTPPTAEQNATGTKTSTPMWTLPSSRGVIGSRSLEQEAHENQQEYQSAYEEDRASVESSLESFNFQDLFDDSPPASQQSQQGRQEQLGEREREGPEEEDRMSVARSEDSFRQFVTEGIESPLFVTDESERDFEEDLAWDSDDEGDAAA